MVRFDGAMCVIRDGLGVEQTARWSGSVIPRPGDSVQVVVQDGTHLVTGRTVPTPTQGKVLAISGTSLQIQVSVGPSPIEAAFTYASPAVGDIVALSYGFEGFIATGRSSYTPPQTPIGSDPGSGAGEQHPAPFLARIAGNWQAGSWGDGRPQVSDSRVAGWWYGPELGATLPDGATITLARIYLPATQTMYAPPVAQAFDGPPPYSAGVGAQVQLGGHDGWQSLPIPVAEQLRTGSRGVKLTRPGGDTGTWDIYQALSTDPMSGALDIAWR